MQFKVCCVTDTDSGWRPVGPVWPAAQPYQRRHLGPPQIASYCAENWRERRCPRSLSSTSCKQAQRRAALASMSQCWLACRHQSSCALLQCLPSWKRVRVGWACARWQRFCKCWRAASMMAQHLGLCGVPCRQCWNAVDCSAGVFFAPGWP